MKPVLAKTAPTALFAERPKLVSAAVRLTVIHLIQNIQNNVNDNGRVQTVDSTETRADPSLYRTRGGSDGRPRGLDPGVVSTVA